MYLVLITGFKSLFVILKNMSKNNRSKSQEAHLGSDSPAPTLLDQQADQQEACSAGALGGSRGG
jgi:hypothetical protein